MVPIKYYSRADEDFTIQILLTSFGLKPSPAILNTVLQKHLGRYSTSEQEVYQVLSQSFYVDDFVGGVTSYYEGVQMY